MSQARWVVKKVARHTVALGSWASMSLAARRLLRRSPSVRALTYHRIGEDERDPFCVSRDDFEAQVRYLSENRLGVSLAQLQRFVAGTEELPDGACLITIDDGMISTLTEALPILRRWGVPAVAFISAGLIDKGMAGLERYMTWDEVRTLSRSGVVDVGSHAYSHRSLGLMPPEEAAEEASRSKKLLEDQLGKEVTSFAYPYGTRTDFNGVTERVLADAGYEIAFNSMHGSIRKGMDPVSVPRVKVEGGEGMMMFRLLRQGAMDPWRAVDQTLWRLQRVRKDVLA